MGRAAYDRYWAAPLSLDAHLDRLGRVYETVMRGADARGPVGIRAAATA
jgi:hypothetical protein